MSAKTIVTIDSELEMLGFLKANGTSCRFVSMLLVTPVKNIKAGCPYKGVMKYSRKNGLINRNYNTACRNGIAEVLGVDAKSVEYTNGESWMKHLETADGKALPVCVNKKTPDDGKYYLQYFPMSSENVYQMPDGTPVSYEDLKQWFYERNESSFKPLTIAPLLSNIKELRASGVIMQTSDVDEAKQVMEIK